MNVSGPVRVFALVGALAALGLGAWFFLLGGQPGTGSTAQVKVIKPLYGGKKAAAAPRTATKAKPATRASAKPKSSSKAAPGNGTSAKPTPKPKPKHAARQKVVPNPNGLPLAVARAFTRHAVVVVSLYDPEAKVDRISLGEARAGARRAGVGFVALNVLDRRDSEALTRKLGVLSAPAFFLFKRPGELVMRIDGFADSALVAQAAVSVLPPALRRPVQPSRTPVSQARWSARANAICRQNSGVNTQAVTTREEVLAKAPGLLAAFGRQLDKIKALALPTAPAARARTQSLLTRWEAYYALDVQILAAVKAADARRFQALLSKSRTQGRAANTLAADLGATTCTLAIG